MVDFTHFNSSNRFYLEKDKLPFWIGLAVQKAGGQKALARELKTSQNNIYGYIHRGTKSIRGDILKKIINFLKANDVKLHELLKDVRKVTSEKSYTKKTIVNARNELIKKYGRNAFEYIQSKSRKSLHKKYGRGYMKVLSKRGHQKLLEMYGENAFKIITAKGFRSMKKKYGKNYRSVINKICHLKRKEKCPDYLQKRIARTHEKAPLTLQEDEIAKLLDKHPLYCARDHQRLFRM